MTTVHELFRHAGVYYGGAVSWGVEVPLAGPGVYVVSTSANRNDSAGLAECPLNFAAVNSLLEVRPETSIDGDQADAQQVANRLNAMWPAGEPVVYIGLAGTSTRRRVSQFYETSLARGLLTPEGGQSKCSTPLDSGFITALPMPPLSPKL